MFFEVRPNNTFAPLPSLALSITIIAIHDLLLPLLETEGETYLCNCDQSWSSTSSSQLRYFETIKSRLKNAAKCMIEVG